MSDKAKKLAKAIAFLLVFSFVFIQIQDVVKPNRDWPTKDRRVKKMVYGLFQEPKDSLDVIWVGTSQVFSGISPMEVYRASGLRSYDLSVVGERVPVGYYLLKSAMGRQSPKVVAIDASSFFYTETQNKVNAAWQGTIDSYPISRIADRLSMAAELARLNGSSLLDEKYLKRAIFPLLHYHTNYKVGKEEFVDLHLNQVYERKGYVIKRNVVPANAENAALIEAQMGEEDDEDAAPETLKGMQEALNVNRVYLERMKQLCEAKGCEFVLLKIPVYAVEDYRGHWSIEKHNMVKALAEDMGVRFLDMNYEDVGMNWQTDSADGGKHLNLNGSLRVSRYLANWLTENFAFEPREDRPTLQQQWDYQLQVYDMELESYRLRMVKDVVDYMRALADDRYMVMCAVSGGIGNYWTDEMQEAFQALTGCIFDLRDAEGRAYVCQSINGLMIDQARHADEVKNYGNLEGDRSLEMVSVSGEGDKLADILVDDVKMDSNSPGIHFVVFDNVLHCITDSVSFNTWDETCRATRSCQDYETEFNEHLMEYVYRALKKM